MQCSLCLWCVLCTWPYDLSPMQLILLGASSHVFPSGVSQPHVGGVKCTIFDFLFASDVHKSVASRFGSDSGSGLTNLCRPRASTSYVHEPSPTGPVRAYVKSQNSKDYVRMLKDRGSYFVPTQGFSF